MLCSFTIQKKLFSLTSQFIDVNHIDDKNNLSHLEQLQNWFCGCKKNKFWFLLRTRNVQEIILHFSWNSHTYYATAEAKSKI